MSQCAQGSSSRRRSWRGELARCKWTFTLHRATPSARGCPATSPMLARHKIVAFGAATAKSAGNSKGPRGAEVVELPSRIGCDDFGYVRATLVAGGGIGLIPRMIAASEVATGRLVRVLPEYGVSGASLYVIYPSARQVPTKVTLFRDFLAKRCAETMRD